MRVNRCTAPTSALITGLLAILCAAALASGQSALDQEKSAKILSKISGKWVVSSVSIYLIHGPVPHTIVDDPTLMGRYEDITPSKITGFDYYDNDNICDHPYVTVKKTTGKGIVTEWIPGDNGDQSFNNFSPPVPIDYDQAITEYSFKCNKQDPITHKALTGGVDSLYSLPDGRLMDFYSPPDVIVFLSRADPNAKPNPSFDCGKAKTPTEIAICNSIELSSFDRAIANTYNETKKEDDDMIASRGQGDRVEEVKNELAALRKLQRDQLEIRNKCGGDSKCLLDALRHNAEALVEFVRQTL